MTTLGVSVYPDLRPIDEICDYLGRASAFGYARVFSSLFNVEGTNEEVLALFGRLIGAAHEMGMEVSLDINPSCMRRYGAKPDDLRVFQNLGVDILRMDGAYDTNENVLMLKNSYGMKIEYNASSLDPAYITELERQGAPRERILACHNFYPQRYTGFPWDKFLEVNKRLGEAGVRIGAFVASHAPESHGIWDATCGLPTVERLRDLPASLQARLLVAAGTTDVFFGNAYATDDELVDVRNALCPVEPHYLSDAHRASIDAYASYAGGELDLCRQRRVCVEPLDDLTEIEKAILFEYFPHIDMGDSSEWIWRSRGPRTLFAQETIAPRRYEQDYFQIGDIVMVNDLYKHYAGEVQVVLRPIRNDGIRNLVARISPEEMLMFDVIHDGDVVIFDIKRT